MAAEPAILAVIPLVATAVQVVVPDISHTPSQLPAMVHLAKGMSVDKTERLEVPKVAAVAERPEPGKHPPVERVAPAAPQWNLAVVLFTPLEARVVVVVVLITVVTEPPIPATVAMLRTLRAQKAMAVPVSSSSDIGFNTDVRENIKMEKTVVKYMELSCG